MTGLLPAAALAAALGLGAPSGSQDPAPPQPVLLPTPDAADRVAAPAQPEPPARVRVSGPEEPVSSTPGTAVGRADEAAATAGDQRSEGRNNNRSRTSAPRGRSAPAVHRGSGYGRSWWRLSPVYVARPYFYDPFWVSGAFAWSPFFYAPWPLIWATAGYGSYPWYGSTTFSAGGLRLKVRPRDAEVFVDGFYAGVVDDFDGMFQSIRLAPGGHTIEVRRPGFETITLNVHIQPDRTLTVEEAMRPQP